MKEFRVTKYNPALRGERGAYLPDDWTSISDIGSEYNGNVLTLADYQQVENAYVDVAFQFMQESRIASLVVTNLENPFKAPAPSEGDRLAGELLRQAIRSNLREIYWCRLVASTAFIHFGYDYYMYIGVPGSCPLSRAEAESRGLFVEPFRSPYHPAEEES